MRYLSLLAAVLASTAVCAAEFTDTVEIPPGFAKRWSAPRPFTSVIVGNPNIVDAKAETSKEVMIGMRPPGGTTNIILLNIDEVVANVLITSPVDGPPCTGGGAVSVALSSRSPAPLCAAEERSLKPKDVFKECEQCPEMVVVPAGSFAMGSPTNERERSSEEGPQHRVTLDTFAVGRFAVTFDEWDACVADGGCGGYMPVDEGWGRGQRPVLNVSWEDAKAYVAWLSSKTKQNYRLLSEAEREYVTRAGTTTPFWWGSSISTSQANYNANYIYNGSNKGVYRQKTEPVDSFAANPWGLYQVHGNVWEWVEDCWHGSYTGAPTDGSAWNSGWAPFPISAQRGPNLVPDWVSGDCPLRVLRGGSWSDGPWVLRAANRYNLGPDIRYGSFGFRVGRTLCCNTAGPSKNQKSVSYTAQEIFNLYEENEVATDTFLKDKIVYLTGSIQSIDKDQFKHVHVYLKTSNRLWPANVTVRSQDEAKIGSRRRGQIVQFQCLTMKRWLHEAQGEDCALIN
jgi:formylglycine-generating enzyme required for sulfatase activity